MTDIEWTLASLRIYLEALIAAVAAQLSEHKVAADRAVSSALMAMEKRLDGMNAFRQALADQTATFITRTEADAEHRRLQTALDELWVAVRLSMPRAEVEAQWTRNVVITADLWNATRACIPRAEYDAAHLRVVEQLAEQGRRMDRSEGRSTGLSSGWGYLVAALAALGAIVSIFIALKG